MIPLIKNNLAAIEQLCKKFGVTELYVFGSAAKGEFKPIESDVDFAVVFDPLIPLLDMPDRYFGFIEELERLLGHPVDIVSFKAIKNPIFKEELEKTMVPVYAA